MCENIMVFAYSTHLTSNILYIEEEELYDKFRTFWTAYSYSSE